MPKFASPTFLRATERDLKLGLEDSLLRTLIRARPRECALEHDKVFSLYGIALRFTPEGVKVPKANYKLSFADAYIETATNVLQSSSDLHMLAHVEGRRLQQVTNLPSWVPDWSVNECLGLGITGHKRYCAAGEIARYLEFPQPRVIRLRGACIARISMQGESRDEVTRRSPPSFPSWVDIISSLGNTYNATQEPILEAFWRTLIKNTGDDRVYPARLELGVSFHAWLPQTYKLSQNMLE